MNVQILIRISYSVSVTPRIVVVDGPNVHTDNICLEHDIRNCRICIKKYGGNTSDKKYWDRTLDIHRLQIVTRYVKERGLEPRIFILDGTLSYIRHNRHKFPEVKKKHRILKKLMDENVIVMLDREKWKNHNNDTIDDIWWISFALEIDAYAIMTNDSLRDWREKRKDIPWDEIDKKKVSFMFDPKEATRDERQTFISPELKKQFEMPYKNKLEMAKIEEENLLQKLVLKQQEIAQLTSTTYSEKSEGHDFRGYESQIIKGWLSEIDRDGGTSGGLTGTIWTNVAACILGMNPDNHLDLYNNDLFDRKKVMSMLGYDQTESITRILEDQMVLIEQHTGLSLKFSPDRKSVDFLNTIEWWKRNRKSEDE